jgi:AcrR family transcriptional regulator
MADPKGSAAARGYHHGDLRRALLDAAETLMAEGTDDPSLRAVARRAGVSHAAPYKHFADRKALRAGVAARGFDDLRQRMRAAAEGDPDHALRAVGRAYVAFALDRPALYRLMFGPEFADGRGTPELDRAAADAFEALVDTGGPATQSQDARTTAVAQWSLVHGLATLLIDGRVAVPADTTPLEFASRAMGSLTPARR